MDLKGSHCLIQQLCPQAQSNVKWEESLIQTASEIEYGQPMRNQTLELCIPIPIYGYLRRVFRGLGLGACVCKCCDPQSIQGMHNS